MVRTLYVDYFFHVFHGISNHLFPVALFLIGVSGEFEPVPADFFFFWCPCSYPREDNSYFDQNLCFLYRNIYDCSLEQIFKPAPFLLLIEEKKNYTFLCIDSTMVIILESTEPRSLYLGRARSNAVVVLGSPHQR